MSKKMVVYKRRLKTKKLYLENKTIPEIAQILQVSESVVKNDIREINKQYQLAIENNPHILEKQAEYILKHLDELSLVKKKLYEIESKTNSPRHQIQALQAILHELSHEARVLKLIDVSKTIQHNYIHIDKINILMTKLVEIVKEFVPLDKQKYAFARLSSLGEVFDGKEIKNVQ